MRAGAGRVRGGEFHRERRRAVEAPAGSSLHPSRRRVWLGRVRARRSKRSSSRVSSMKATAVRRRSPTVGMCPLTTALDCLEDGGGKFGGDGEGGGGTGNGIVGSWDRGGGGRNECSRRLRRRAEERGLIGYLVNVQEVLIGGRGLFGFWMRLMEVVGGRGLRGEAEGRWRVRRGGGEGIHLRLRGGLVGGDDRGVWVLALPLTDPGTTRSTAAGQWHGSRGSTPPAG